MTWYAIRTVPGSQMPQRELAVEPTALGADGKPRGKGYRIVPSLNANVSAIERALSDAGFVHYMPSERRLIRDRRHTELWKGRRFALLVGYVFVADPYDFRILEETPGVLNVVKVGGKPMAVDLMDILFLRTLEAAAEAQFDQDSRYAKKRIRLKAKKDPRLKKLIDKLDGAEEFTVPLNAGVLAA